MIITYDEDYGRINLRKVSNYEKPYDSIPIEDLIDTWQRSKWIPCSERLPDIDVPVLVCWSDGKITDGYRWGEDNWFCAWEEYNGWHDTSRNKYIVAWMPLPKKYD